MTKSEILAFLNENHLCFLATVEGNKPHVRGMDMFRGDENGLVFYTDKQKDVYKQIAKNPEVEICYPDAQKETTVRVSGKMEILDDLEIKKEIVSKRPFLKPVAEQAGYDFMGVFRLKNGKATVWSMQDMAAPKTFVDL